MTGSVLDDVLACIARGWSPIPVPFRTKKPVLSGWQHLRITAETAPAYFNGAKQNFGVILGPASHGLADGDMDCAEAIQTAPYFLPKTSMFGRQSAPASHWLYYRIGLPFERVCSASTIRSPAKTRRHAFASCASAVTTSAYRPYSRAPCMRKAKLSAGRRNSLAEPVRVAGSDLEARMCRVAAASLTATLLAGRRKATRGGTCPRRRIAPRRLEDA